MKFANIFQKVGLTLAAIILSVGFFINSLSPATASNNDNLYENGRYMIQYETSVVSGQTYWYLVAWDTQTGKSKAYYGNGSGWNVSAPKFQLPSNPLD
ncbi:MAG: hypothetical protein GY810_06235 [Aureispira sp.]|nr:hypothetical protein [Aureispira sp.]